MRPKVAIIDYGVGNVHSISAALGFLGYKSARTRTADAIRSADALILPGVGAFGQAMANLKAFGLLEILNEQVCVRKKPLLGICLGMQVLGKSSQESPANKGLGWIDFDVKLISPSNGLKVPHVGWNTLRTKGKSGLFKNLEAEPHFYFDHSYYADCPDEYVAAYCDYGIEFPAVVIKDNILGIQCHPEKSQGNGLKFFRNYFNRLAGHA